MAMQWVLGGESLQWLHARPQLLASFLLCERAHARRAPARAAPAAARVHSQSTPIIT